MLLQLSDETIPGALPRFTLDDATTAPVVAALGGISATRHVRADDLGRAGWWATLAGDAGPLSATRARVLGMDFLDGGENEGGRPVTECTTRDQADALARVLNIAGVERLHALVGASYGGMVALAFAERYPERVERLVVISAAHEPHPMSTALRSLQRRIVELGLATGESHEAMAIARGLAMTTYRTAGEFADRFPVAPDRATDGTPAFSSEAYLRRHGSRFADAWSPARFLALSLSCDTHRVDPRCIVTPTLLLSAEDDAIVPAAQMRELAQRLAGPCRHESIPTRHGHDAFLLEQAAIAPRLDQFLSLSPRIR